LFHLLQRKQHRESSKIKKQKCVLSERTSEKNLNEMEISNLPNKEFKVLVIKMSTELKRRMHKHNENFNRDEKYKEVPNRNYRAENT